MNMLHLFFFDMENTHDFIWRHDILKDLSDARIVGWMFSLLQNSLKPRSLIAKINAVLIDVKTQTDGNPKEQNRGSVLTDNVNDLQMSYRHPVPKIVKKNIPRKHKSSRKFYMKKKDSNSQQIKPLWFTLTNQRAQPHVKIQLGITRLQKSNSARHLDLMFDQKLELKAHKPQLKCKCNRGLNLIRVRSTEWGADQKSFMIFYIAVIRSKLNLGCILYNSATASFY